MSITIDWKIWSDQEICEELPNLLSLVESNLNQFGEGLREKNSAAVRSLQTNLPSPREISAGVRSNELVTLALALDRLARQLPEDSPLEKTISLFHGAHELCRGGNGALSPTKAMRHMVINAVRAVLIHAMPTAKKGETDADSVLEQSRSLVRAAWGNLPAQVDLFINEMILDEFEQVRIELESDQTLHAEFVKNNIEAIQTMEIPTRLESTRNKWIEIGQHVAPQATRTALLSVRRPQKLSEVFTRDNRQKIGDAIIRGSVELLCEALSSAEEQLETNLRLRLNARTEYREPVSEVRFRGAQDRFFIEARDLLSRNDRSALTKFQNILRTRSGDDPCAKEWLAYAWSKFGTPGDKFEIIPLLQGALESEFYRPDRDWTARWNLACTLRTVETRQDESLDILLPVLENDIHAPEVFELCLLWALEQDREDVLPGLFPKAPYFEAHLLAALRDARAQELKQLNFNDHFRRINRILRDPDRVFPDPVERLDFDELDQLTMGFIDTSMVVAGIEWFKQRLSSGGEQYLFKNWECVAKLHEELHDFRSAWRCRQRQWNVTFRKRGLDTAIKTRTLESLLGWALQHDFESDALRILRESWQQLQMTASKVKFWEAKLSKAAPMDVAQPRVTTAKSSQAEPSYPGPANVGAGTERRGRDVAIGSATNVPVELSAQQAENIIQETAGSFTKITDYAGLVEKSLSAERLLLATCYKHPTLSPGIPRGIREILRLATQLKSGVGPEDAARISKQLLEQSKTLKNWGSQIPYELSDLIKACEKVAQNTATRFRVVSGINITPPDQLREFLATPSGADPYLTRIFCRLFNPSSDPVRNVQVSFVVSARGIQIRDEKIVLESLGAEQKQIVECEVRVTPEVGSQVEVDVLVSFEADGIYRSTRASGQIPVRPFLEEIPGKSYIISSPIGADRPDLFHGRDRELKELQSAFSDGQLQRLYFVNGVRAVGKSSLMKHLIARCGPEVLPVLIEFELMLKELPDIQTARLVQEMMMQIFDQTSKATDVSGFSYSIPNEEELRRAGPWRSFDEFLDHLRNRTGHRNILIGFDEMQFVVKRIAEHNHPLDDSFLSWLRAKVQARSHILVVCTGSEPYMLMRKRYEHEHNLWRHMDAYNVSFVSRSAMEQIACKPIEMCGVLWLPEALDRLWDMTEGHPWVIQVLCSRIVNYLNRERRRVIAPLDVDRASDEEARDNRVSELWWNESAGFLSSTHRQIAYLILQSQGAARKGVSESELTKLCHRAGIRTLGKYLEEMQALEVITEVRIADEPQWRIRGRYLEQYLNHRMKREILEAGGGFSAPVADRPVAIMLDWENVKICLSEKLEKLPTKEREKFGSRLNGQELAILFKQLAARHGKIQQYYAVANWELPSFAGDQRALKNAGYWPDISGSTKADASDHVLKEKIHYVLTHHPEIQVFVVGTGDGDYSETIRTVLSSGKQVVLWAVKEATSRVYGHFLTGPDRIQIEWLEDLIFPKSAAAQ